MLLTHAIWTFYIKFNDFTPASNFSWARITHWNQILTFTKTFPSLMFEAQRNLINNSKTYDRKPNNVLFKIKLLNCLFCLYQIRTKRNIWLNFDFLKAKIIKLFLVKAIKAKGTSLKYSSMNIFKICESS